LFRNEGLLATVLDRFDCIMHTQIFNFLQGPESMSRA